jgi:hypothetical protein
MLTISEALAEAAQREPDLASYYGLYRALFELQERAKGDITATLELADEEALQARTLEGLPQLSFAQLPIKAGRFASLAEAIAELLRDYYASEGIEEGLPVEAAEWVSPTSGSRGPGDLEEASPPPPHAEMAVDQALQPYLAGGEQVHHLDQQQWLRDTPGLRWRPDLAFLPGKRARVTCVLRCNSQWLSAAGLFICGTGDHELFIIPARRGLSPVRARCHAI